MGVYLNSSKAQSLYKSVAGTPYFVDKTRILEELIPLVETGNQYICITRPRRFGKTVMANLIGSYFGKGSSEEIFSKLEIADHKKYQCHLNKHNVIYITFNELPRKTKDYTAYMERIESRLLRDLVVEYPDCGIEENDAVWDAMNEVHERYQQEKFIFVLDEWDYIFHKDFVTQNDRMDYISFLSNLLKDQPYVELAYMTGILPIAKYSSGSELNMFLEYTMASRERYADYFGFTETEVDQLYERYLKRQSMQNQETCDDIYVRITDEDNQKVTREGLREWYDGYHAFNGERMYNPRSVVSALQDNQLADYWTSSGPYDEIYYYVKNNVLDIRDDIAIMMGGEAVSANVKEYAATSTEIRTRDQIMSAMVVYGFLAYDDGKVRIPNKELMDKFADMVSREDSLGYVYRLAKESERMLEATKSGDTDTMEQILQQAHDTEADMKGYNCEAE